MSIEKTINVLRSLQLISLLNNDNQNAEHEELTKCHTDCVFIYLIIYFYKTTMQISNANYM